MTSFTTIGFGDILPSKREYMIIVGILLLIGLALVSTLLSIIQQQIEALAAVFFITSLTVTYHIRPANSFQVSWKTAVSVTLPTRGPQFPAALE
jgi:hypothetical protein